MRKVANQAGISATAIYRHFENKEEMLFNLVVRGSDIFLEYLSRGLKGKTPKKRLVLCGEAYCDFALEHPSYYRILFMAPKEHLGLERLNAIAANEFACTFTFLVDRVRECMESNVLSQNEPEKIAAMLWAHNHGLCSLRLSNHLDVIDLNTFRKMYTESCGAFLSSLSVTT